MYVTAYPVQNLNRDNLLAKLNQWADNLQQVNSMYIMCEDLLIFTLFRKKMLKQCRCNSVPGKPMMFL